MKTIWVLDQQVSEAPLMLADRHVAELCDPVAQALTWLALRIAGDNPKPLRFFGDDAKGNSWHWWQYGEKLLQEHGVRFGGQQHSSLLAILKRYRETLVHELSLRQGQSFDWAGSRFKPSLGSKIVSIEGERRRYLNLHPVGSMTWNNRSPPPWLEGFGFTTDHNQKTDTFHLRRMSATEVSARKAREREKQKRSDASSSFDVGSIYASPGVAQEVAEAIKKDRGDSIIGVALDPGGVVQSAVVSMVAGPRSIHAGQWVGMDNNSALVPCPSPSKAIGTALENAVMPGQNIKVHLKS